MSEIGHYIVFDSGIGGLTVLKELLDQNINAPFIYVADNKNGPYGDKTEEEIKTSMINLFDKIFRQYDVEGIILACNTASVVAIDDIRQHYNVPVYSISEHIQELINKSKEEEINVLATERTTKSNFFKGAGHKNIRTIACPSFAPFIESESLMNKLVRSHIVDNELNGERVSGTEVYLGCTHYPFLEKELEEYFGATTQVINPARTYVKALKSELKEGFFDLEVITTGEKKKVYDFLCGPVFNNVSAFAQIKLIKHLEGETIYGLRTINF